MPTLPNITTSGGHTAIGGGRSFAKYRHDQQDPQETELAQLLQLAQLQNLMSAPEMQQQELDQADQKARMTAAIQLLGLKQDAEQHQATLAETQRSREATNKSNVLDTLVSHLSQRPDVPLSTLAETLRKGGHSELADTLDVVHSGEVKTKVATHLNALKALGSDQKKTDTYLQAISGDPEVSALVKSQLPAATPAATDTTPLGSKLGSMARLSYLATQPTGQAYLLSKPIGDMVSSKGVQDFWNALINKPQPTY
jgi:hypothetical protein